MADSRISKPCTVYALASSEDSKIRYIGQTVRLLKVRLQRHLNDAKKGGQTPRDRWIRKVLSDGFEVCILPLIENAVHHQDEIRLIEEYRRKGFDLLNLVDGGQGCLNPSPEYRERMKAARKEYWNTELGKATASIRGQNTWKDPDISKRRIASIKAAFATEESKAKRSRAMVQRYKDSPELLEKASARTKEQWKDPELRQQRCNAIREALSKPEYIEALSERLRRHWEDPERRKQMSEKMKGRKYSPETIQKMSEAAKRRYAEKGSPLKGRKMSEEYRRKQSEAQKKRFAEDPKAKEALQKGLMKRWGKI